jgi:hypothetical protein
VGGRRGRRERRFQTPVLARGRLSRPSRCVSARSAAMPRTLSRYILATTRAAGGPACAYCAFALRNPATTRGIRRTRGRKRRRWRERGGTAPLDNALGHRTCQLASPSLSPPPSPSRSPLPLSSHARAHTHTHPASLSLSLVSCRTPRAHATRRLCAFIQHILQRRAHSYARSRHPLPRSPQTRTAPRVRRNDR